MLHLIKKINWFLCAQLGIDLRLLFRSIRGIPRYIVDFRIFRTQYKGKIKILPCLADYDQEGGSTKSEYFWQDLFVAQNIFHAKPVKHVDIGSRIDSFVAHVASFREIEVFDIRAVTSKIPGVFFRQADFMKIGSVESQYCESLSCLHALEHFGLGRYGDPLNPDGYKLGLKNMARILKDDGVLYLSVPIGVERVEFNAHRVFNPTLLRKEASMLQLELSEFAWVDQVNVLHQSSNFQNDMFYLSEQDYNLGIFTFKKMAQSDAKLV